MGRMLDSAREIAAWIRYEAALLWDGIQGTPLDEEHPERDFWIVVAASIVPVYIVLDLVVFS